MRRQRIRPLAIGLAVLAAAGCGHQAGHYRVSHGTLVIDPRVTPSHTEVLGVKRGTAVSEVRRIFGPPQKTLPSENGRDPHLCWIYPAKQKGTSIDYVYFCFDPKRRVDLIVYGVHL